MRKALSLFIAVIFVILLAGCDKTTRPTSPLSSSAARRPIDALSAAKPMRSKWTVLVYMSADNELDPYAMDNIHEMEAAAPVDSPHPEVTILVQLDRANTNVFPIGTWTDTRRYHIVHTAGTSRVYAPRIFYPIKCAVDPADPNTQLVQEGAGKVDDPPMGGIRVGDATEQLTHINSPRLDNPPLGELDMGDPKTLQAFIRWGQHTAPADHYLVVVWGHGCGWMLSDDTLRSGKSRAICEDDGAAPDYTTINSAELSEALTGSEHIDVVAMDACMMAMLENAFEIRQQADYLVASEEETPDRGFYYPDIIGKLTVTDGNIAPADLAKYIAWDNILNWQPMGYTTTTMSAIALHKVDQAAHALDVLARYLPTVRHKYSRQLRRAREECKQFGRVTDYVGPSDLCDVCDYLHRLSLYIDDDGFRQRVTSCERAVRACVLANATCPRYAFAQGLSIYIPPATTFGPEHQRTYDAYAITKATAWSKWLAQSP